MIELVLMMAQMTPKEEIAKMVQEAAANFLVDNSKENWGKLMSMSMLIGAKEKMEGKTMEDALTVGKDFHDIHKIKERMESKS